MTTEQPKAATPQDQPYPPPMVAYPNPHFTGGTFPPPPAPPGAYQPHFFAYAPPDGTHPEANGANGGVPVPQGPPLVYPYPPGGMIYYPPHPPGFPVSQAPPAPTMKPKRKQVKMACTNCATACKRCDESRPCERCIKYGMPNTCVDGQRKERKKGVKRGPYKRKNKAMESSPLPGHEGEWPAGAAPPTVHAVPSFHAPGPEGFYPVYYPGFPPPPHIQDGQSPPEGAHSAQPPVVPFLIPAGFPPYAHHYPYPPLAPQPTVDPVSTSRKAQEDEGAASGSHDNDGKTKKKKSKTKTKASGSADPGQRTKRAKASEDDGVDDD
ncbi:hypothetical protein PC9H_008380 [Pleurotus ostreatus]|uniref:Transcription activator of gluconeogenesis ERT1 n=1 Tax=Pleurotus ostreatus TaxID=5322 RepID=A0A8H7DQJ3_PLEOS|nr:uncharacterized protein PC9H_008380 [Pleurotus ostreatus]KAF7426017.1 hypothetical protein PC9H_008380 [Pleurotus ostreatus]